MSITIDPEYAWAEGLTSDQWFDHDERLAMASELGMLMAEPQVRQAATSIAQMEAIVGGVGGSIKALAVVGVREFGSFRRGEEKPLGGHRVVAVIPRPLNKKGTPVELFHPDVIASIDAAEAMEIERRNRMAVAEAGKVHGLEARATPRQAGGTPTPQQTKPKAGSLWEHASGKVTVEIEA